MALLLLLLSMCFCPVLSYKTQDNGITVGVSTALHHLPISLVSSGSSKVQSELTPFGFIEALPWNCWHSWSPFFPRAKLSYNDIASQPPGKCTSSLLQIRNYDGSGLIKSVEPINSIRLIIYSLHLMWSHRQLCKAERVSVIVRYCRDRNHVRNKAQRLRACSRYRMQAENNRNVRLCPLRVWSSVLPISSGGLLTFNCEVSDKALLTGLFQLDPASHGPKLGILSAVAWNSKTPMLRPLLSWLAGKCQAPTVWNT